MPVILAAHRNRIADSSHRRPIKRRVEKPRRRATITVGPEHHGRRMSLAAFAEAEGQPGYNYELERGMIVVVKIPNWQPHFFVWQVVRDQFAVYRVAHSTHVLAVGGGGECALRMPRFQSERHPDLSVYLFPKPPPLDGPWEDWVPEITVEIVSKRSIRRDYVTKREEYLAAGVRAYWIIDPLKLTATVLTRRGETWHETKLSRRGVIRTPLLPGFELKLTDVFAVVK